MRQTNLPYDRAAHGRLLTVPKVMELLECSRSFVYQLIKKNKLKHIRLGVVKGLRVPEKSVLKYLNDMAKQSKDYNA